MEFTPEQIVEMCRALAERHWHLGLLPDAARYDYAVLARQLSQTPSERSVSMFNTHDGAIRAIDPITGKEVAPRYYTE